MTTVDPRYLEDASGFPGSAEAVHIPRSEAEVVEIVRSVSGPITIAGAGTGVTGARVPANGHVLSLEKFDRIEIHSGYAIAGAGVTLSQLQAAAARTGQFYAPDPTEIGASVGGTIATNASGSRSFLYGDTRRHVLGLTVVMVDGTVLRLERGQPVPFAFEPLPVPRTTKNTAGFYLRAGMDFLDLFIGSEGTLGIITEAHLKLLPIPAELLSGVVFFPSVESALTAVDAWRPVSGLRMLEYIDSGSLELLQSRYSEISNRARAALLIEQIIDTGEEIDQWLDRVVEAGALEEDSWFGTEAPDRERFRKFRHALPELVNDTVRRRGLQKMGTDFAVPVDQNAAMMQIYIETLGREFPKRYVIFGHIGDAHVHANVLPADAGEALRAKAVIDDLARAVVSLGGTVSAEHGLGKRKKHMLPLMFSEAQIESMREVKRRLDPEWRLGQTTLFESQ